MKPNILKIHKRISESKNYKTTNPLERTWDKFRIPQNDSSKIKTKNPLNQRLRKISKVKSKTTNSSLEREKSEEENSKKLISFKKAANSSNYLDEFRDTLKKNSLKVILEKKLYQKSSEKIKSNEKKFPQGSKSNKESRRDSLKSNQSLRTKIKNLISKELKFDEFNLSNPLKLNQSNLITPKNLENKKPEGFYNSSKKYSELRRNTLKSVTEEKKTFLSFHQEETPTDFNQKITEKLGKRRNNSMKLNTKFVFENVNGNKNSKSDREYRRRIKFNKSPKARSPLKTPQDSINRRSNGGSKDLKKKMDSKVKNNTAKKGKLWTQEVEKVISNFKISHKIEDFIYTIDLLEKMHSENRDLKQKLEDNHKATQNLMEAFFGFQNSLKGRCRQKQTDCEERIEIIKVLESKIEGLRKRNRDLEEENNMFKVENENMVQTIHSLEENFYALEEKERVSELEEVLKTQELNFEEEKEYLQLEMVINLLF